jgi:C1A family cysteine protease
MLLLFLLTFPAWFHTYIDKYGKSYTYNQALHAYHTLLPKYNELDRHPNLQLQLHNFSDQQRTKRRLKYERSVSSQHTHRITSIPSSLDWRPTHVTSPVRQGGCGGCYAIAAVGNLEYWYRQETGHLEALSIQEALDCSKKFIYKSSGCDGGLMEDVFQTTRRKPIALASTDPFQRKNARCPFMVASPAVQVLSYNTESIEWGVDVEKRLAHNVYTYGPIPVGIDSSSHIFDVYHGGIIHKHQCGNSVDHAVLVVGYTPQYWIIKNSWGTDWGEDGYFRLERGVNACAINTYASYAKAVRIL